MLHILLTLIVSAQQQNQGPHPLSNLPAPGQVATGWFFPDHVGKKHFAAGKLVGSHAPVPFLCVFTILTRSLQVEVVLGFHNEATMAYNVTAIMGSLNSPMDFSIFVQNFTNQVRDLRMGMKFGIKRHCDTAYHDSRWILLWTHV